jgi:hypothetical protein
MQTPTVSTQGQPPSSQYSPSVPLYVYRELVADLQALEARLDVVTAHNQKLAQENQLLRQEIAKVIQSFAYLQQLTESSVIPNTYPDSNNYVEVKPTPKPPVGEPRPRQPKERPRQPVAREVPPQRRREEFSVPVGHGGFPTVDPVYIKEQQVRYYATRRPESKELSGWWLFLTIVLIMITGFGAGYLIVRPLFQLQNQTPSGTQ